MLYKGYYTSPLGEMLLIARDNKLISCDFMTAKYYHHQKETEAKREKVAVLSDTMLWLNQYFNRQIPDFCPDIDLEGTAFQKEVWELLLKIPYGKTVTYKDIAEEIALKRNIMRMSNQAVGQAVSKNPISIIVPCHRVIGTDGSLTGYASGVDKKKFLLELEMHGNIDKETVD